MKNSSNDAFINMVIEKMWAVLGKFEYVGLTPYQVARKMGLNHDGAVKVEKLWNGPSRF